MLIPTHTFLYIKIYISVLCKEFALLIAGKVTILLCWSLLGRWPLPRTVMIFVQNCPNTLQKVWRRMRWWPLTLLPWHPPREFLEEGAMTLARSWTLIIVRLLMWRKRKRTRCLNMCKESAGVLIGRMMVWGEELCVAIGNQVKIQITVRSLSRRQSCPSQPRVAPTTRRPSARTPHPLYWSPVACWGQRGARVRVMEPGQGTRGPLGAWRVVGMGDRRFWPPFYSGSCSPQRLSPSCPPHPHCCTDPHTSFGSLVRTASTL